jgi:hypothetical protein
MKVVFLQSKATFVNGNDVITLFRVISLSVNQTCKRTTLKTNTAYENDTTTVLSSALDVVCM